MSLVECVPNFSVGSEGAELDAIVGAIEAVEGATILDRSADPDHQRAVVTFAGPLDAVEEAAFRAVAEAARQIDMTGHRGVHPRIGATDVLPFVPIGEGALESDESATGNTVELARRVAQRVGAELEIPVYLYGEAARLEARRALPAVRRGGLEALGREIATDPSRLPDHGPARLHPTAGATAVGVRPFLLAYNVNLESNDLDAARAIAREVRERDGGLPGIRALGFALDTAGIVQVSANICDYQKTGILALFREVERRARARGIRVRESELVGLAPRAALNEAIAEEVRLRDFDPAKKILEELVTRR